MEMQPQESACSQALRLPEILQNIFQNFRFAPCDRRCKSPPFDCCVALYSCALVCRLWEIEASKVSWERCGVYLGYDRHPKLSHLARISSKRRQRYADLIKILHLSDDGNNDYRIEPSTSDLVGADLDMVKFTLHGPSFLEVSKLSFPRLDKLMIENPFTDRGVIVEPCQTLPIHQFLQPKLRKLQLIVSNGNPFLISESVLQHLEQNVPMLEDIEVRLDVFDSKLEHRFKISSDRLATFLGSFQSTLRRLRWLIEQSLSAAVWQVLCSCPRLKILILPLMEDCWLEGVIRSPKAFQSLEEFEAILSERAFSHLMPLLENIRTLKLREISLRPGMWNNVMMAGFRSLTSISLTLHGDTVLDGVTILNLARSNVQLQRLLLESFFDEGQGRYVMSAINFTDATVTELARLLPRIEELTLTCYDKSAGVLGDETMISLGSHCPLLRAVFIYADVDWKSIFDTTTTWPCLQHIGLCTPIDDFNDNVNQVNTGDDADDLARELLRRMPLMAIDELDTSFYDEGRSGHVVPALWKIVHPLEDDLD